MDAAILLGGIGAAFATSLGVRLGSRIVPAGLDARSLLKKQGVSSNRQSGSGQLRQSIHDRQKGRKRDSSIIGIYKDVLRHTDGSYSRFYSVPLEETMLSHDMAAERRCDELARILCIEKPPGTVIQC